MTGNELIALLLCGLKMLAQYHIEITDMQHQTTANVNVTNCLSERQHQKHNQCAVYQLGKFGHHHLGQLQACNSTAELS
jgi:hypothetical protein